MRVLLVNAFGTDTSAGGAERYAADLCRGLRARGVDVHVLSAFASSGECDAPTRHLHAADPRRSTARRLRNHLRDLASPASPRLRALVDEIAPDLVHTNNLPGIGAGVWEIARRGGIPVVHTVHDYHLLCPKVTLTRDDGTPCRPHPLLCGARTRRLGRWAGAVSDIVAVSQFALDAHRDVFPRARAHVIRHPLAAPASASPAQAPAALRVLGYLGALERNKGVGVLLEATPRLVELGCRVRVAGDGRMKDEVAEAAGRVDGLEYAGRVDGLDKEAFLDACDAGVVPSVWPEPGGPPFTVVEWLARRRPVLVSERGGLAEVAATLPGCITVAPTADALVETVRGLLAPTRFADAAARVEPLEDVGEIERWLDAHEAVYAPALGS